MINEFDIASGDVDMPQENEFDVSIQQEKLSNQIRTNIAVDNGLKKNQAIQADVISISNRTRMPADFVERNIDTFKHKKKVAEYDGIRETNPALADWAQNPNYVAASQGDLPALKEIESSARMVAKNKVKQFQMTGEMFDAGHTGLRRLEASGWQLGMAYGLVDIKTGSEAAAAANKRAKELQAVMPSYAQEFNKSMDKEGEDVQTAWNKFKGGFSELREHRIAKAFEMIHNGGLETLGESVDMLASAIIRPKGLLYSSTESAAFALPSIVGGFAGVPLGGPIGIGAGVFAGSAVSEIGGWINGELENRGYDITSAESLEKAYSNPELMKTIISEAKRKGIATAAVDAIFSLGAGKFIKGAKGSNVFGKMKAVGQDVGTQMAGESVSEAAGQYAATGEVKVGEALLEGMSSMGSAASHSAAGASVGATMETFNELRSKFSPEPVKAAEEIVEEFHVMTESENALEALQNIGDQVKELKNTQNAEGAIKELINLATAGDDSGSVFFQPNDWNEYWTSKGESPIEKAAELGPETLKNYQESIANGTDFVVPLGEYVEKYGPTDDYNALMKLVKVTSDGKDLNEIKQSHEELSKVIQQVAAESESAKKTISAVKSVVKKQVMAAGYKAKDAGFVAQVFEGTANTMSKLTNQTPIEFHTEANLSINNVNSDGSEETGVLNQSAETAPPTYSKLIKTINEKVGKSATPDQVIGLLKDIKEEEIEWFGIKEFLKGKTKVSKEELEAFINGNMLEVIDSTLGTSQDIISLENELKTNRDAQKTATGDELDKLEGREYSIVATIDGLKQYHIEPGKFEKYTLPGGENYREVLFTLPVKSTVRDIKIEKNENGEWDVVNEKGRTLFTGTEEQEAIDYKAELDIVRQRELPKNDNANYRSSHFDQPNILAHTRLTDRTDADGKKVLFIEEIQSDWHQEGRKKGYNDEKSRDQVIAEVKALGLDPMKTNAIKIKEAGGSLDLEMRFISEFIAGKKSGTVPNAPFKKTWHEYAFKRILRMAAENGYDRVAWTTGEQQAERFDLAKQISRVESAYEGNKRYKVSAYDLDGKLVMAENAVSDDKLEDMIGKDLAAKIVEFHKGDGDSKTGKFSGVDLKVGGEGMKGFYDNILVKFADKFVKKYGAKVGETDIETSIINPFEAKKFYAGQDQDEEWAVFKRAGESSIPERLYSYMSKEDAQAAADKFNQEENKKGGGKVHSLDMTPELKDAALHEGFTLFQENRGSFKSFKKDGVTQRIINLFKTANKSTLLHEAGHYWLDVMGHTYNKIMTENIQSPGREQFLKDVQAVFDYLGVSSFDEIKTEHHEIWARSTEKYFMEGKAPTTELQAAFTRFLNWLTDIYKELKNINAPLTDDIREVMDRLLASREAISENQPKRMFEDAREAGLSKEKAAAYEQAREEMRIQAEAKLTAELMEDLRKKESAQYKKELKEWHEKFKLELLQTRTYKAMELAAKVKINPEGLNKDLVKRIPKNLVSKKGQPANILASLLGYTSGREMAEDMANNPNLEAAAEMNARAEMAKRYPDRLIESELKKYAEEIVNSDMKAKLLRTELEMLINGDFTVFKDVLKVAVKRLPTNKEIRRQADGVINSKQIGTIKPYIYKNGEKKASKLAAEAFAKGDINALFEAKKKELLNFELYRSSVAALENMEKFKKRFKKINGDDEKLGKSRAINYIYAARAIMSKYELSKLDDKAVPAMEQLKQYDRMAYEGILALTNSINVPAKPQEQLTYLELTNVYDTVDSLWDMAKASREIEIDGKKFDKNLALSELIFQIGENTKKEFLPGYSKAATSWEKTKVDLLGFKSTLRRVEHWVTAMDKGEFAGVFRKYIWNPISEAASAYRVDKAMYMKRFSELTEKITKGMTFESINSPELGYEFKDKAEILGMLTHIGNDSNKRKLLLGREWATENLDKSLNMTKFNSFMDRMYREGVITKNDMDYIQAVWDLYEELKPGAQKAHKQLYGYYFDEITANEFTTPFGVYRGGYVPAMADSFMVEDKQIREEQSGFEMEGNSFNYPTTGKGATMTRVEYNRPLILDIRQFTQHMDWALRFAHIQPKILEVSGLVMSRAFRDAMYAMDPTIASELLVPWLQRAAQQKVETPAHGRGWKGMAKVARALRTNAGMQAMVFNLTNALQQFTGFSITAVKVKPRYIRNALLDYVKNSKQMSHDISEKSAFMHERHSLTYFESKDRVNEIILNASKFQEIKDWTREHGYFLQSAFQGVVDTVSWKAAYDESVEAGLNEKESIRRADSVVRETQGSFNAEDISEFEAGSAFRRLFTMFYSYFNMQSNLLGTEFSNIYNEMGVRKGAGRMLYVYTMGFMIPAVMSGLIFKAMSGKFDEDDDEEYLDDFMGEFFGSQVRTAAAMVPFVGPAVMAGLNTFNDKQYDDRISASPAIQMIESAVRAPYSVYKAIADEGNQNRATRDLLTLLGMTTGVPFLPVAKPIVYLNDVNNGDADPTGPVDFTRGLITGKSGQ